MKNNSFIYFILIFFCACSAPKKFAGETCDCLKESGLREKMNLDLIGSTFSAVKMKDCEKEFKEKFYNELSPLNDSQRAKYIGKFVKAIIDSECGNIVLSSLPYDELLNKIKAKMDKEKINEEYRAKYNGLSLCDCINISEDDSEEKKESCRIMQSDWKEKYDAADFDLREQMMQEVENCN